MDERYDVNRTENDESSAGTRGSSGWLIGAVVVLAAALGVAVAYSHRQMQNAGQSASHEADMSATIDRMQAQIDTLNSKMNQPPPLVAPAPATAQPSREATSTRRRLAADNKRIKDLQAQVADEQNQLKSTQDQVAQNRTDLEGSVNATRDELNGSIARTHDELVALEQKGERSYTEFDLYRAKHFVRTGPVVLSLRKADPKHKTYDVAMVVDDNQISKKNVDLFEPVWINGSDMQQIQIVVNKIDKNHVHGYVSAPKYSQSASLASPASHMNAAPEPNASAPEPASNQPASSSSSGTSDSSSPAATPATSSPTTQLPQ